MGGHTPQVPCNICRMPINLSVDLCADEEGKAIHEDCYVKHVTRSGNNPPTTMMAD